MTRLALDIKQLGVLSLLALGLGCSGLPSFPTVEQLSVANRLPTGTDPALVTRGRSLLMTSCDRCHRNYRPEEYAPAKWADIVQRMSQRSQLDAEEAQAVTRYAELVSHWLRESRSAPGPKPEPPSEEGNAERASNQSELFFSLGMPGRARTVREFPPPTHRMELDLEAASRQNPHEVPTNGS